jgi:hypothetical protein
VLLRRKNVTFRLFGQYHALRFRVLEAPACRRQRSFVCPNDSVPKALPAPSEQQARVRLDTGLSGFSSDLEGDTRRSEDRQVIEAEPL